ncbi:hypothetical protein CHLRE_06g285100v5 [Chlamydomonas reinhardtii]|uniref:Uncharacterized protein n=1 Tax=Chlamydomonas reinhardtii TaxID=3055 RepID=A0A2K3DQ20_CHLRE|nr:uncharacterized protein CHLRE_06g285100v5 [Chlamydomonas reinhardtii]PNW82588.1 hypothetical protein CHLRE_06g285100v5 [Chlamydomonas reinhardtii]
MDAAERSPKRAKPSDPEGPCDSARVPAPSHGPTPGALCRLGGLGSGPASLSRSCKLTAAASPGRQPHTADEQPTAAAAQPADPPTAHDAGSGRLAAHPHPGGASATPGDPAAHSAAGEDQAEQPGADTWGEGGSGRTSSIDTVGSSADDADDDDDDDSISGSRGGPGAGAASNLGDALDATRGIPARSGHEPGNDGAAGGAGANSGAGGGGAGASAGAAGATGANTVAVQHPGPLAACARLRVMLMNATAAAAIATGARQLAKSAKAGKTGKAGVTPTPELAAALAACYLPELDWEASPDSGVYTVFRHSHTHRNSLRMGVAAAHVLFPDTLLEAACRPAGVTVYFYYQRPPTASKETKDAQRPQQPSSEHTADQPQTASCPDQEPDPEAEPTLVIRDGLLRLTTRSDYTPKYGTPPAADADPSAAATSDATRLLADLKAQPRARAWLRLPRDSESPCMDRPIVFVVRPDGVPVMRAATYREAAAAKLPPPPLAPMAPPVQDAARTLAAEKWRERLDRLAAYNKLLQMPTWQAGAGAGAGASAAGTAAVASTVIKGAEGAEGPEEVVAELGPEPGFGPAHGSSQGAGKSLSRQLMRSVHDTARRKGLVFRKLSWSDIRSPTRLALGVRLSPVLLDLPRVAARWRHHMEEHARRWPHARCWMGGHALCAVQEVVARVRGGAAGPGTGASAVGAGAADGLLPSALHTAAASGGGLGGGSGGDGGGDGGGAGGSSSSTGGSSTNHMHLRPLGRLVLHTEDGGQFQVSLEVGWRAGVSGPTTVLAGPSLRDLQLRLRAFSGDTLVFRRLFTLPTGAAGAAGVAGSANAGAGAGVAAAVGVGAGGSVAETSQPQQQQLEAPGPGAMVLYTEPGSADALGMARANVGGVGGGGADELSYVDEVVGEFMVTIDRAESAAGAAAGAADKGKGKAEGAAACAAATDGGGQGAVARAATAAAAATEAAHAGEQPGPAGAALGADAAGAAGTPGGAAAVAAGGVGGGGSAAAGASRAGPSMSKASLARKRLALVMVEGAGGGAAAPPVRKTKQQVAKGKAAAGARGGPAPPPLPSAAAGRDAEAEAKRKREQMALLLRQVLG